MKVRLAMDCGYAGSDYEEEVEVDDDTTEEELEELAVDFFGITSMVVMVMK